MEQIKNFYHDKTNQELFDLYKQTGDLKVKQEITMRYLYVIKTIAIQMRNVYLSFAQVEDIVQEGVIVLMKLIDKYDEKKNVKFETYLSRRMRGMIIDIARKQEWGSRNVRRNMKTIEKATAELTIKNGKVPDSKEVAEYIHMPYTKFQETLGKNNLLSVVSLDMVLEEAMERNRTAQLPAANKEDQPEETYIKRELSSILENAIDQLNDKEKIIISLYYVEELNMREIAQILEVSEPRISQLHSGAIKKMKTYIKQELQL